MPEKHTARRFSEYNRILKETDELYRSAVKTMGRPIALSGFCIRCGKAARR